jgi:hypothetical protein
MDNLVYNIPTTANDGEQYKDNNITKYLESNKSNILGIAEKNYENLVEALTNDSISSAATSSSDPTLSLRSSSSSTFLSPSNQSDIYRIEEAESFRNSKGDIAD